MQLELTAESEQMPPPADVERLLARASEPLGAGEAAMLARTSARMYSWARAIPGSVTACAHRDGELDGFGYGYSWRWDTMADVWALRLRDELGARAARLDDTFAVVLLVVAPPQRRAGLGGALLTALARHADERVAWLQTGATSPLRAVSDSLGWRPLDAGADPVVMLSR